ncbi:hypothetical protein [Blastococcus sp. SYSU DS0541]
MQIAITFDPERDAAEDVALALAYAYGYETVEDLLQGTDEFELVDDEPESPPATAGTVHGWTKPKMKRYVSALRPTARKILRAIAEGAPEVSLEQAQEAAGLDAYKYAGAMSSFGFAARNTRGVKEKPFTKDGKTYLIQPAVADVVLAAMDELGF